MAAWLSGGVAGAAELRDILVEVEDGHYSLRSETFFDVERESLYSILSNFDLFERFTSAIAESRNEAPDDEGRPQFYSRLEGCVLVFCQSFVRAGHVVTTPPGEIIAIADPERSNFKFSKERWELQSVDNGTLLIYEFNMEPAFWVPPVVGPYFIKRSLRDGGEDAVDRIEAMAQKHQAMLSQERQKVVKSTSED